MYKDLNDNEILYMVCEENSNDFDILYQKYQPLIYKCAKEYVNIFKKYGYEIDDLMQIGYLTLYKSSYMYKNYNTAIFYTYFKKALKNALVTEIKKNCTLKKEVLNNSFSYDKEIDNTNISYIDIIPNKDDDIISDEVINLITRFKNSMPYEMSWVFELYYNGYNINEICILLDKKENEVRKNLRDIKSHGLTYRYLFL